MRTTTIQNSILETILIIYVVKFTSIQFLKDKHLL